MANDPAIFQITDGACALAVVNKAASGYADSWVAPTGKTALTAVTADYGTDAPAFRFQVTSAKLTASKQSNRTDRPATFCSPASSTVSPSSSTYTLDVGYFLDEHMRAGLASFLYANDTLEGYFLLGLGDADTPPKAVGRVLITAGDFGGDPQTNRTGSISLDVRGKPDIVFGRTGSTRLVTGTGTITNAP